MINNKSYYEVLKSDHVVFSKTIVTHVCLIKTYLALYSFFFLEKNKQNINCCTNYQGS